MMYLECNVYSASERGWIVYRVCEMISNTLCSLNPLLITNCLICEPQEIFFELKNKNTSRDTTSIYLKAPFSQDPWKVVCLVNSWEARLPTTPLSFWMHPKLTGLWRWFFHLSPICFWGKCNVNLWLEQNTRFLNIKHIHVFEFCLGPIRGMFSSTYLLLGVLNKQKVCRSLTTRSWS